MSSLTLNEKLKCGFRLIAQEKLQNILYSIPGARKDIVIEADLIKPLEHICGATWLRTKGIQKIYRFDQNNVPNKQSTAVLIYLVSTNVALFKKVLTQIHDICDNNSSQLQTDIRNFHIIVTPNVLHSFECLLEEEGLYGLAKLHRFNWDFINIDLEILSLEIPHLFRDVFVNKDCSLLSSIAQSLRTFNFIFKKPPLILAYGEHSESILRMVDRMEQNDGTDKSENKSNDFDVMLVLDRNKDYTSCLLTPVIYAGLLQDIFRINSGILKVVDVKNNKINEGKQKFLNTKMDNGPDLIRKVDDEFHLCFNSSVDSTYRENRYKQFTEVVSVISAQVKNLEIEGRNLKTMQIKDMQNYIEKKLPLIASQKKELFKHLVLCETIVNELGEQCERIRVMEESMVCNKNRRQTLQDIHENLTIDSHKFNSLRQICLFYLTCSLSYDEACSFVVNYLNTFGYNYMGVFRKLSEAGLFADVQQPTSGKVNILSHTQIDTSKLLNLVNNPENLVAALKKENSLSICFVLNGLYVPVVAQILHGLLTCERMEDFFTKHKNMEQLRCFKYFDRPREMLTPKTIQSDIKNGSIPDMLPLLSSKTFFVFIVGGLTYAEAAACHQIECTTGAKIVIGSNCILSGVELIESAFS